jgi:hypothetical protein
MSSCTTAESDSLNSKNGYDRFTSVQFLPVPKLPELRFRILFEGRLSHGDVMRKEFYSFVTTSENKKTIKEIKEAVQEQWSFVKFEKPENKTKQQEQKNLFQKPN